MPFRLEPNPVSGLLFGVALAALSFLAAGAGHGIYLLMGASSAPAGILGVWAALAGAPVLWTGVGVIFDWVSGPLRRRIIPAILLLHYCGVVVIVSRDPYGDWAHLFQLWDVAWPLVAGWAALYAFGQVVLWRSVCRPPANEPLQPTSGLDA